MQLFMLVDNTYSDWEKEKKKLRTVHTYICTYIPWIRVSKGQKDLEQVIYTQIYTVFTG